MPRWVLRLTSTSSRSLVPAAFSIGRERSGNTVAATKDDICRRRMLTKILGNHSLRRLRPQGLPGVLRPSGHFAVSSIHGHLHAASSTSSAAPIGQRFTAFLLGLPNGNDIVIDQPTDARSITRVLVRTMEIGSRLTLTSPAYDYELAPYEWRTGTSGVDRPRPSRFAQTVQPSTRPTRSRNAGQHLQSTRRLLYTSADNRRFWSPTSRMFSPRRIRLPDQRQDRRAGGVGLYSVPFVVDAFADTGTRSHAIVVTPDGGLSFMANAQTPGQRPAPATAATWAPRPTWRSITYTPTTREKRPVGALGEPATRTPASGGRGILCRSRVQPCGEQGPEPDPARFLSTSRFVTPRSSRNSAAGDHRLPACSGWLNEPRGANQLLRDYPQFTG